MVKQRRFVPVYSLGMLAFRVIWQMQRFWEGFLLSCFLAFLLFAFLLPCLVFLCLLAFLYSVAFSYVLVQQKHDTVRCTTTSYDVPVLVLYVFCWDCVFLILVLSWSCPGLVLVVFCSCLGLVLVVFMLIHVAHSAKHLEVSVVKTEIANVMREQDQHGTFASNV